jgi:hypothetical protein
MTRRGVRRLFSPFDVSGSRSIGRQFVLELVSVFHHDPEPDQAIRVNLKSGLRGLKQFDN